MLFLAKTFFHVFSLSPPFFFLALKLLVLQKKICWKKTFFLSQKNTFFPHFFFRPQQTVFNRFICLFLGEQQLFLITAFFWLFLSSLCNSPPNKRLFFYLAIVFLSLTYTLTHSHTHSTVKVTFSQNPKTDGQLDF